MTEEQINKEAALAWDRDLVRVPADKCGLYLNTFVYNPTTNQFRLWRGSITTVAGRMAYPVYVRKAHLGFLKRYESGPEALMHNMSLKIGETKDDVVL